MARVAISIEFLENKMGNMGGNRGIYEVFDKYFCREEDTEQRPSKEVAIWFFKELSRDFRFRGEMRHMLDLGYLGFKDVVEAGQSKLLTSNRNLMTTFFEENCSMPMEEKEMRRLFSFVISVESKQRLAYAILSLDIAMVNVLTKGTIQKNNFINCMNNNFAFLLSQVDEEEPYLWMWKNCSYIPTAVIKEEFRKAVPFSSTASEIFTKCQRHFGRCYIPIEQTLELIPYFASLPQTSSSFPFNQDQGSETMIDGLNQAAEDLAKASSEQRNMIYKMYIKPLITTPTLFLEMFSGYGKEDMLRAVTRIGAAVTPASDLVKFVKEFIFNMADLNTGIDSLLDSIGRLKTRASKQVSVEFIALQMSRDIGYEYVCFNNDCINDLNFWKKLSPYNNSLFAQGLQHNKSFNNTFKLNVDDLPFYKENRNSIIWSSFYRLKVIPKEFLMLFSDEISLNRISGPVLASLDEEILEVYLNKDTKELYPVPSNIFRDNHSFGVAFIAKYAERLLTTKMAIGHCSHISLKDLVKELE